MVTHIGGGFNVCVTSQMNNYVLTDKPMWFCKITMKMILNGCDLGFVDMIRILFYLMVREILSVLFPNCHIFLKEGGGLRLQKISPFQIVTNRLGREGLRANAGSVMKYVVFFLKASLNHQVCNDFSQ